MRLMDRQTKRVFQKCLFLIGKCIKKNSRTTSISINSHPRQPLLVLQHTHILLLLLLLQPNLQSFYQYCLHHLRHSIRHHSIRYQLVVGHQL
ncbi:unnamed protein product [Chironomus riparius]|uniref:Uncharacterized protein n=1 Tax=Chironomus riparius TaxID=315576 RepID=A0A9N9S4P5_9DIPT|nr:unnamed protein product [Chironomus riparius]